MIHFKTNTDQIDQLKRLLKLHGLDLELTDRNWFGYIFWNNDYRSFCGYMIDSDHILMFPDHIPNYIKALRNDPLFHERGLA